MFAIVEKIIHIDRLRGHVGTVKVDILASCELAFGRVGFEEWS